MVGIGHELIRFFCGPIQAYRAIGRICNREGDLSIGSIDRGRGGISERKRSMAAHFQYLNKAFKISPHISLRIFYE